MYGARRTKSSFFISALMILSLLSGCQDKEAPIPSTDQMQSSFTIADGVLTAYTGTETEIELPGDVIGIAPGAFAASPVAGDITRISLGAGVETIDPLAFSGLTALRAVDADTANAVFQSGASEQRGGAYLCGSTEPTLFYFPGDDGSVYLSYDGGQAPYLYGEGVDVSFICNGAVFTLFYEDENDQIHWYCRSIRYGENQVDYQEPVEFEGGNFQVSVFETSNHKLVFQCVSYNFSDAYIVTKDVALELHPEDDPDYAVSLYCGKDGELRYKKIRAEYATQEQADEISPRITSRDEYYGEDGLVTIENGVLVFTAENQYTVSDYFESKGTDIDTWFQGLPDCPYGTLEELMRANRGEAQPAPYGSADGVPSATAEMFGLSGMDAALFEGALTQDVPYSSGAGVTIPYVGVYGQYEADGKLYVICGVSYQRYDADVATRALASAGTTNTYGRAILSEKDGTYACESFDLVGEDASTEKDLREFCGDQLADLPDKIIGGGAEYTSNYPSDMVSIYCQMTGYTA